MGQRDPLLFPVVRQRTVQAAQRRARRLWPTSKGFQGAYVKGWRARRAGLPADACPYNRRTHSAGGTGTWTWAWRDAWTQGWIEGE